MLSLSRLARMSGSRSISVVVVVVAVVVVVGGNGVVGLGNLLCAGLLVVLV